MTTITPRAPARPPIESRLLFSNDASTPLGRLTLAGFIADSAGIGPAPRRLGSYAVVYLLDGGGRYWDERGHACRVQPGDLIMIFPEVAHCYGPAPGERWSELYVVFDGPCFDLWRQAGVLTADRPVRRVEPLSGWLARLEDVVARPSPRTIAERTLQVSRFLALLTEMLAPGAAGPAPSPSPPWLARACELLEADMRQPLDPAQVAGELGMAYETFRKQFQRHVGVSPARYRAVRRIDMACALLQSTTQTAREVALSLGFSDEFHFSRRFKQITGLAPREFRRRLLDTARDADGERAQ